MTTDLERKRRMNHHSAFIPTIEEEHIPSDELLLSYVPKTITHIVDFSGIGILRPGYITTIVGPQGTGKSNVTEAIISSLLNPYVDNLGFRVKELEGPALWMDGERTKDDIAMGFQRIRKRSVSVNNPEFITGDRFKDVYCHPLITHASREYRIKELQRLCELLTPSLLLLDGMADYVRDVNNTNECVDFIALLTALANQYNFGVIGSIHPNPDAKADYKPRGVLGSELIRTSESMLLLKRAPDNRDIRMLTTVFAHGKNRSEKDNLEHFFQWDNEHKMFLSCEYTPTVKTSHIQKQADAFNEILTGRQLPYDELVKELIERQKCNSAPTAKRWIGDAVDSKRQLIFKKNGMYGLTPF